MENSNLAVDVRTQEEIPMPMPMPCQYKPSHHGTAEDS
jgi:hypothetical protein